MKHSTIQYSNLLQPPVLDEDSEEEELDDGVCPVGFDPVVFDQICVLRERRMDAEEALVETKKAHDAMKKELDTIAKKVSV